MRKPFKLSRSKILKRFTEISTPNYKVVTEKRWAAVSQSPEDYHIWAHFGVRGRQENFNSRNEHFKSAKNENGRVCHVCRVKPHKDENISYKASRKDGRSKNGG